MAIGSIMPYRLGTRIECATTALAIASASSTVITTKGYEAMNTFEVNVLVSMYVVAMNANEAFDIANNALVGTGATVYPFTSTIEAAL